MTQAPERPVLTPVQRVEIGLYEEALRDNLRGPVPQPVSFVLVVSDEAHGTAEHVAKTERHVRLLADVARYIESEGLTTAHFSDVMVEFSLCTNVAWILRGREDFFKEQDSLGCAVLSAAGIRPV